MSALNNKTSPYYDPYGSANSEKSVWTNDTGGGDNNIDSALTMKDIDGIFGIPYQFLASVDRRMNSGSTKSTEKSNYIGRKYGEKIMSRLPLLFLTPCKQQFMEGFNSEDKASVISSLISGGASGNLDRTGRYYDTAFNYDEYYKIVNRLATILSSYIGIGDLKYKGKTLSKISWQTMNSKGLKDYFAIKNSVVFYVDGMTSISDSFSNSTTESSLASSLNSFSDQAKEVRFLLGNDSALVNAFDSTSETAMNLLGNGVSNFTSFLTNGMIGDLATTGVSTVLSGGKLLFPKIWADSQFSRSYSFDIKLRSPDHDSLSIFVNVLLPYLHLLGLAMPKSITSENGLKMAEQNPNAYTSPFLVRAYAKGMFNINMGIITELSVTRGKECEWNVDGLPTQMDISLTIEDLYTSLFLTDVSGNEVSNNWDLVTNTELMDFLANLGGLNVATDVSNRKVKYLEYLTVAGLARTPATLYTYFENGIANKLRQLWDILN